MGLSQIEPKESVALDTELLDQMCARIGVSKAEAAICAAMEDLAVLLQYAGTLRRVGELDTLSQTCRQIEAVSKRVGMVVLARVAKDAVSLCDGSDEAALAAVTARLQRVGERSLIAIWDRDDITV